MMLSGYGLNANAAEGGDFKLEPSTVSSSSGSSTFGSDFKMTASHIGLGAIGESTGGDFRVLGGYIYTLNRGDRDSDSILDGIDNCPIIGNINQDNLDSDAFGDVCDDDVDGDLILNGDDPDDDNDGMNDVYENNYPFLNPFDPNDAAIDLDGDGLTNLQEFQLNPNLNPVNPDTDGDGIDDGLDTDPIISNNTCIGADTMFIDDVFSDIQCAATNSITVELTQPNSVQTSGHLTLIAPMIIFQPGFKVQGKLNVRSTNPCTACGP